MTLPTLPTWAPGSELNSVQLNQIKNAIQDGTLDIKTGSLESTAITENGNIVAKETDVTETFDKYVGHGWYQGTDTITIADGNDAPFTLGTFNAQNEALTTSQGTTAYWDLTTEKVNVLAGSGEGNIRVSFLLDPSGNDKAIALSAIVPDPLGSVVITSETRRTSKRRSDNQNISFNIPFWINDQVRDYGIEIHISNDEVVGAGQVIITEPTVTIQQFGGRV